MQNGTTHRKPTTVRTYSPLLVLSLLSVLFIIGGLTITIIGDADPTKIFTDLAHNLGLMIFKIGVVVGSICGLIYLYRWAKGKEPKQYEVLKRKNLYPWLYGNDLFVQSDKDTEHIVYPDVIYHENCFMIAILPGLYTKLDQASREVESYLNSLGFNKMVISHHVKNNWMIFDIIDDFQHNQLNGLRLIHTHEPLVRLAKKLNWDYIKHPNALLTGPRNSGKSWLIFSIIMQMASAGTQLFIVDPKESDAYRLRHIPEMRSRVVGNDKQDVFAFLERFVDLLRQRIHWVEKHRSFAITAQDLGMPAYVLIFEEYAAFTAQLNTAEKKKLDALLTQINLLGRQYSFMAIYVMQQARASTGSQFSTAMREQMGLVVAMGQEPEQSLKATFGYEYDIPQVKLSQGEGLLWMEGNSNGNVIQPFTSPDLSDLNFEKIFKDVLKSQSDDKLLECSKVPASQYPD